MVVRDTMINGHNICHGGYVFLLADTAFAFACNTYGPTTVAATCDIAFLAPPTSATSSSPKPPNATAPAAAASTTSPSAAPTTVIAEFRGHSRTMRQ
jgi:acyl-CoA thioesterase